MSLCACGLLVFGFLAAPALAETPLPKGARIAEGAHALLTFKPRAHPGRTDFNPADRLAIENLISAYAFAYDNREADAWFSLFTEDAVFVAGEPGAEPVAFSGAPFRTFWRERMKAFGSTGNMRRHLMANILFLDQTDDTAHVSVVGLLTNAKDGRDFAAVSSLNYEGWLVKQPDGWKIKRWHDFPDAVLAQ